MSHVRLATALLLSVAVLRMRRTPEAVPDAVGRKASAVGASMKRRNKMRVITRNELAHRSTRELQALYAWVSEEVAAFRYQSPEWHNGLITLQNIRAEQASRKPSPPRPRGP